MTSDILNAKVSMGVTVGNKAYVQVTSGTWASRYVVAPREEKHEYAPDDYDVTLEYGPDVLRADYVKSCAHDAFIDAFGAN